MKWKLFSIYLLIGLNLNAQSVLNFGDYEDAYGISAFLADDGNIIHFGFDNQTINRNQDLIINKVDPSGNVIQTSYFGTDSSEFINYVVLENNSYYAVGNLKTFGESRGFVIKLNQSLQQIWYKLIGAEGESVSLNSIAVEGEKVYVGGANYVANLQFHSVLLDTSGQILWSRTLGNSFAENINSVFIKNSICYATGDRADVLYKINPVIIRYDVHGNLLQVDDFNILYNSGSRSIRVDNNNIFIIGETAHTRSDQFDIMLYKFSLEGEIIHSIHFGEPQKSDAGFDLLIQGDFLHITGYAFQPTLMHKSIVYLVLSKNLEILNSSYFEVNHIQIGNRITHKEEQILISGQALDADSKFVVVTEIPTSFIESKSRNITFTIKSLFDTWLIEFSENVEDFSLFSITGIRINGKFNHISLNQIEIKKPEFSGFFILKVKLNSKIFSIKLVL